MIIDCHGHYTTAPDALGAYRERQKAEIAEDPLHRHVKGEIRITDDQIRESLEGAQLRLQRERGTDLTIFSPRASWMGHHIGNESTSIAWTEHCNDLIHRITRLYPENFAGVAQLPQTPGVPPDACARELERCVHELGFIGCNLNPDPSGGYWTDPPLGDRWWYPFYEKMVELDAPAMIHVSAACNPAFHTTGSHYLGADTTAVMQMITSNIFRDFPAIRFIIPHGGGAVPYHWGRFRGLADMMGKPPLSELILEQRVLRHLRLPPAGDRPPARRDPRRQHPVRLGDGGSGAGYRPGDRALLRRHEALHRCRHPERCGPDEDLREQRAAGLHPAEGAGARRRLTGVGK